MDTKHIDKLTRKSAYFNHLAENGDTHQLRRANKLTKKARDMQRETQRTENSRDYQEQS